MSNRWKIVRLGLMMGFWLRVGLAAAQPWIYVANTPIDSVSVVDATTQTVVTTVAIDSPTGVAAAPDQSRVYVANRSSGTLSVIDTGSHTVITAVPVGSDPIGVAVAPSGALVYVANRGSDTVSVVDTATLSETATIRATPAPGLLRFHDDRGVDPRPAAAVM